MEKIKIVFLFALILAFSPVFGQFTFHHEITNTPDNEGLDFVVADDGGFYLLYQEYGSITAIGCGLLRLDPAGNVVRHHRFTTPIPGNPCTFNSIHWIADGNFLISDTYLRFLKVDTLGNVLWAKGLPYPSYNAHEFTAATVGQRGELVFAAHELHSAPRLLACDTNGDILFHNSYNGFIGEGPIVPTPDGGYLITDIKINKFDSAGNYQWTTHYTNNNIVFYFEDLLVYPDGSFTAMGSGETVVPSEHRLHAAHFDSSGSLVWIKRYDTQTGYRGAGIVQVPGGGFLLAGHGQDGILVIRTDPDGVPLWARSAPAGTMNTIRKIAATPDGGFALLGRRNVPQNRVTKFIKADQNGFDPCALDSVAVTWVDTSSANFQVSQTAPLTFAVQDTLHQETYNPTTPVSMLSDACQPTSAEEDLDLQADGFLVYPNPGTGPLRIQGQWRDGKPTRYTVYDALGRKLSVTIASGAEHLLRLEVAGTGTYMVMAEHGDRIEVKKALRH